VKRVAILQSNYIPWKGYFDLIRTVDEFILYDDMQYTRRDWRNRNRIKTSRGLEWLTVPVKVKGRYYQTIRETELDGSQWALDHWRTLLSNYGRAPFFSRLAGELEALYLDRQYTHLSQLNRTLIEWVCSKLGISTLITDSSAYELVDGKTERLLEICRQAGATEYLSGPAAADYLEISLFEAAGLRVRFFDYTGYPPYPQLWGEFEHGVTILDLLLNCGPEAAAYLRRRDA
jgi:hypothetical protein